MEAPPPPPPGPPPPAGRQAYPPPPPPTTAPPPPPPPPPGYTPSQGHEGPPPHHGPKRPPSTGQYRDHRFGGSEEEMEVQLANSTTLYVGNLSFFTTEEQIYELFSRAGEIKRIIMGLDRFRKTPCGFCFAEYYTKEDATACFRFINGTRLDDRTIRTDWDAGFAEGRQYGRGKSGGQVRDEYRTDFDPGRGGYGKQKQLEIEAMEKRRNAVTYLENLSEIPAGGDFSVGASAYRKRSRPPSFSGGGNLPPPPSHYPPAPYSGQGHPPHPASDHDLPPTKRIRDESENPRFRPERSGKESDDEDD